MSVHISPAFSSSGLLPRSQVAGLNGLSFSVGVDLERNVSLAERNEGGSAGGLGKKVSSVLKQPSTCSCWSQASGVCERA